MASHILLLPEPRRDGPTFVLEIHFDWAGNPMKIDPSAWDGYRVVWVRLDAGGSEDGVSETGCLETASNQAWPQALQVYCRATGKRLAELCLHAQDNQPNRFIQDVAAAVDRAYGLSACTASGNPSVEKSLDWIDLINRISAASLPMLLALEGYDLIEAQAVHELVAELLDYPPDGLQIAIFCRGTPPLPLARLRARRALLEVGN